MKTPSPNARPMTLFLIAITVVVFGGLIGAITNAVNGAVSPRYFVTILGWHDLDNVWGAAIDQGIFEGLIYGAIFAIVFTLVVGVVSKARISFGFALKRLSTASVVALVCWCLGGLLAMGLATLSPAFYRNTFIGVPSDFHEMLKYAWVGGSIWGVLLGAVFAVLVACVTAAVDWRRQNPPVA
jgi:hypothetical protein